MGESAQHRVLVSRIVNQIHELLRDDRRLICLSDEGGVSDETPPLVNGFRPDVLAYGHHVCFLGEAKPPGDIESRRTERQLKAFMKFIEEQESRHLMLSVHWTCSALARAVLRSATSDWKVIRDRVHVLDGVNQICLRGPEQ